MESELKSQYRTVYLTAEDLRLAASVLYQAYKEDPLFIGMLAHETQAGYEKKLRAAIREELNELWQQEQALIGLYDEERLIGVVCMMSHQVPLGEGRYWHWRLKMMLGTGWQSTQALMRKESSILEHLPSKHCAIVQFIALVPNEQKQGLGHELVQGVKSWCEEQPHIDGAGVFAVGEMQVNLFRAHGFNALCELEIENIAGELLYFDRSQG